MQFPLISTPKYRQITGFVDAWSKADESSQRSHQLRLRLVHEIDTLSLDDKRALFAVTCLGRNDTSCVSCASRLANPPGATHELGSHLTSKSPSRLREYLEKGEAVVRAGSMDCSLCFPQNASGRDEDEADESFQEE